MIKYLGSKRLLIPHIVEAVKELSPNGTVLDLFSGTSRVGIALKAEGYNVHANDYASYAHTIAQCYIEADKNDYNLLVADHIAVLNSLDPVKEPGHFTQNYCIDARFFQPKNGLKIEAIRNKIEEVLDPTMKAILLTSLMEAADRVDSTCGVQMAYLKKWASRANNDLRLRMPEVSVGCGMATNLLDTKCLAKYKDQTIVYMDPPYNQHNYIGNYHIWETLVKWDKPEVYGMANKRVEVKQKVTPWYRRREAAEAFKTALSLVTSDNLLLSFNNKGYLTKEFIEYELRQYFDVEVKEISHPAYIGHKIGINSLKGAPVGTPSEDTVSEFLFLGKR